ncbi:hypothetical protein CINS5915_02535 [Campylobacter insulaenigrae]|uniref:hypothetical protein n=1 Tax=Campylobacter insulaenigrae TaxID=260714 RepID=UPI0021526E7B|nr:hypothetical protein [Campylobacter insulaenigrae]MCR6572329.1 hypothetical protein [Campylobacter insulaenigrae]MCR6575246.1 hypothetical protein [Campylobacter insulaenigrae]MCR6581722.1 hypothetical protein [Campylobacter insulaenigrae]
MAYPLLGTKIVLDEEKILKEGKYNLKDLYKTIDEYAKESGMIKIDKETYHCKGDKYDLGCLGMFIHYNLLECDWFTLNVKEWTWLSEKEGNIDLIAKNKARNEGIWQ